MSTSYGLLISFTNLVITIGQPIVGLILNASLQENSLFCVFNFFENHLD